MNRNKHAIKDIKRVFIEKGILKTDALRHEIALSWEKSRLQEMIKDRNFGRTEAKEDMPVDEIHGKIFEKIADGLKGNHVVFVDSDGNILKLYLRSEGFFVPDSFIEGYAGTTAFSISKKIGMPFKVYFSEHYKDEFENYISFSGKIPNITLGENKAIFIILFSENEIDADKTMKFVEECCENILAKTEDSGCNDHIKLSNGDISYEIAFKNKAELLRKSRIYLAGISREIDKLRNELKYALESQKFIRIDGISKESCFSCAIYSCDEAVSNSSRMFVIDRETESIPEVNLMEDHELVIVIDSLNLIARKIQRQIMSLLDSRRKSKYDTKVISIYHHGIADNWLAETIIEPLVSLVKCPRYSYIPIAKRTGDIPFVVKETLRFVSEERLFESAVYASENFVKSLCRYDWPGDVEEVLNLMRFCIDKIGDDKRLSDIYIPNAIRSESPGKEYSDLEESFTACSIKEMELKAISDALLKNENNISRSAAELGVSRSTLYRKMKRYGMRDGVSK